MAFCPAPMPHPRKDRQLSSPPPACRTCGDAQASVRLSPKVCLCLCVSCTQEPPFASEAGSWQMAEVTTGSPGTTSVRGLTP